MGRDPHKVQTAHPGCVGMCWGAKALWLSLEFIEKEPSICVSGIQIKSKAITISRLGRINKGRKQMCALPASAYQRAYLRGADNHSNSARVGLILFVVSFI